MQFVNFQLLLLFAALWQLQRSICSIRLFAGFRTLSLVLLRWLRSLELAVCLAHCSIGMLCWCTFLAASFAGADYVLTLGCYETDQSQLIEQCRRLNLVAQRKKRTAKTKRAVAVINVGDLKHVSGDNRQQKRRRRFECSRTVSVVVAPVMDSQVR